MNLSPRDPLVPTPEERVRAELTLMLNACTESRATCGRYQPYDRCCSWDCCDNQTMHRLVRLVLGDR